VSTHSVTPFFLHQSYRSVSEQDCACPGVQLRSVCAPINSQMPEKGVLDFPGEYCLRQDLYHQDLGNGYEVLYHPMVGTAVLNGATREVLDHFRGPAFVERVRFQSPAAWIVPDLIDAGLLEPVLKSTCPTAPGTLTALLQITHACNQRCVYCYAPAGAISMTPPMAGQAVQAVFDTARQNGFQSVKLKFAGGEPTLRWPVVVHAAQSALRLAEQTGIELDGVLLTNAVLLSDAMIAEIKQCGLRVSISLDGLGAVHDFQRPLKRRGSAFVGVLDSLERLRLAEIPVSITVTLSNHNLENLPELVDFLIGRDLPFNLNLYRDAGCAGGKLSRVAPELAIPVLRAVVRQVAAAPRAAERMAGLLDRTRLDGAHQRACGMGQSYVVIGPDGNLFGCHMEATPVSTISTPDWFKEISTNYAGRNPAVEQRSDCAGCVWRHSCAGGCPLLAQTLRSRSPYCEIYRAILPEIIRAEGERLLYSASNSTYFTP